MFETFAPQAPERRSRSALYEALTFSLFVHVAGGLTFVGATLWEVSFPTVAPAEIVSFVLAVPIPPPPPPPAPKPLEQQETIATTTKVPADAFLAPSVIPDTIAIVKPKDLFKPIAFAVPNGVIGGVAEGQENGIVGGTAGGADNGVIGGTPDSVTMQVDDHRVHIARDKKLPLTPMSQVYPSYPEEARLRGWEDELVVRYVIGKDGRVKEVTILQPPGHEVFSDSTLRAIRAWRFRPYKKDGAPQEVVHELTVQFRLQETT